MRLEFANAWSLRRDRGRPARFFIGKGGRDARGPGYAGRVSPLIWVRCMIRRALGSNASRRCMVQRLSHITRSPTRQTCSQANSGRAT